MAHILAINQTEVYVKVMLSNYVKQFGGDGMI